MNLILTGASGFVGKYLLKYLKISDHYNIQCLNLRLDKLDFRNLNIYSVIHLAGKAHDLKNTSNYEEYYSINFELTKKVYDEFLCSSAQKFIFISSVKACSDHVEDILRECDSPDPKTDYGKSKLLAEEYIQSIQLPEGKSYYILRPCMIHGPGNKGNLNLLYKFVTSGLPYPLGAFQNKRSFLSIENLCFVIYELLERSDIPSGIYNISDDEALSTQDIIKLIASISNKKAMLWKITPVLIRFLAKFGDILNMPMTTERLNKLTENYVVDNSKIKMALGKEFPVMSREGISNTLRAFQKEMNQSP
jgi:nucleoside-diphosphate-sugar epimerase